MRMWEAIKALEEGKKIVFGPYDSLIRDLDTLCECFHRADSQHIKKFITREDYRIYSEPTKTYTFPEILPFLKAAKKVKRSIWKYEYISINQGNICYCSDFVNLYCLKIEDLKADDWIIVEE